MARQGRSGRVDSVKALLFGSVEKIVVHCASAGVEKAIRNHIRCKFSPSIPVSVEPPMLGVEYMQVHYSGGLLRGAHADVMVLG